jgi:hypothetical protein
LRRQGRKMVREMMMMMMMMMMAEDQCTSTWREGLHAGE